MVVRDMYPKADGCLYYVTVSGWLFVVCTLKLIGFVVWGWLFVVCTCKRMVVYGMCARNLMVVRGMYPQAYRFCGMGMVVRGMYLQADGYLWYVCPQADGCSWYVPSS